MSEERCARPGCYRIGSSGVHHAPFGRRVYIGAEGPEETHAFVPPSKPRYCGSGRIY